ncbi:MAG: transcriptional regulator, family [Bacteroidetes bacterium]|jgi:transcriptional regulator with XRE-family HTH domain|nr:transcriptional regulator, family [Bacteroidota bacterium]
MSDKYNKKDWYSMSDSAVLRELGSFIKETRLKKNYTQSDLAEKAGMHRVSLSEFEQGLRGSLTAFIQLLRALNELETLDVFIRSADISPLEMAKLEAKKRKRASVIRPKKMSYRKKTLLTPKTKNKKQ